MTPSGLRILGFGLLFLLVLGVISADGAMEEVDGNPGLLVEMPGCGGAGKDPSLN